MGPPTTKRELRSAMLALRRSIAADPVERARRSLLICERVAAAITAHVVPPAVRRMVMLYDALPGEPDLGALVPWAGEHRVDVFVPAVDGTALRVMPGDVDPASLDAVAVPGLAFTRDGRRLGQGGGHFDRFLPRLAPSCVRIGVAFREQIVDDVPVEDHDVTMDVVITDG